MKKIIISTILASCILCFSSCSSNDTSTQNEVENSMSDYKLSYAPEEYDYTQTYYV